MSRGLAGENAHDPTVKYFPGGTVELAVQRSGGRANGLIAEERRYDTNEHDWAIDLLGEVLLPCPLEAGAPLLELGLVRTELCATINPVRCEHASALLVLLLLLRDKVGHTAENVVARVGVGRGAVGQERELVVLVRLADARQVDALLDAGLLERRRAADARALEDRRAAASAPSSERSRTSPSRRRRPRPS